MNNIFSVMLTSPSINQELQQALIKQHIQPLQYPLFAIESLLNPSLEAQIAQKLQNCNLLIFVSVNAAQVFLDKMQDKLATAQLWYACMGSASAKFLQQYGISQVIYPKQAPFDSQALISAIQELNVSFEKQKVLILNGLDGLPWLSQELTRLRASVEVISIYKRVLPKPAIDLKTFFSEQKVDIIYITCITSLLNLVQLAANNNLQVYHLPLMVVSRRIRDRAIEVGFLRVYTAKSVATTDVLASLLDWKKNGHDSN